MLEITKLPVELAPIVNVSATFTAVSSAGTGNFAPSTTFNMSTSILNFALSVSINVPKVYDLNSLSCTLTKVFKPNV